jgi:polysaccharide export outer membrane protein
MPPRTRLAPSRTLPIAGVVLIFCLAPSGGCGILEQHRNNKIPHLGTYDPTQPRELCKVTLPPYVVEPPDELEVAVKPTLLDLPVTQAVVRSDGVIDLGYYGEVPVSGLTLPDIEALIQAQLTPVAKQKGIQEPVQVAVRLISSARSKQYYVIGTVNQAGAYPITGNDTVLDGILRAGLRSNSLPDKAYLARPSPVNGPEQVLRIDWERIKMGDTMTNYQLMPGDRIVVPGGKEPGLLKTVLGGS